MGMYRGQLARFADQKRLGAGRRMQSIASHARRWSSHAPWPYAVPNPTELDRQRGHRWTNRSAGSTGA